MKLIAVDYGKTKVGIAFSDGKLAQPLVVIREGSIKELVGKIKKIVEAEGVEKIIVGVSEGKMAKKQMAFGRMLSKKLMIPVEFEDETLTTKDAKRLSIETGMSKSKRRRMEDAYAATLILQKRLDDMV